MRRRQFLNLLGGTATWPIIARAQQSADVRRVGVLMNFNEIDPQSTSGPLAFERGLKEQGWTPGRDLQIEYRWGPTEILVRKFAHELIALTPDVILAVGGSSASALQELTRTIPIVFMKNSDPVNRRLIASMDHPGGNFTGLIEFEPGLGRKWLELLKQIAPNITRVAVIHDPSRIAWRDMLNVIKKAAPSNGVEVNPIDVRNALKMESAINTFASIPNGGLIVPPSTYSIIIREQILALALRHKLPAVYFSKIFVSEGGLLYYGPDTIDQYRRAAGYADRIFKGEKPAEMPVQAPTKFEFVLSLRAAQTIGLTIPAGVLAAADHVIK